MHANGYLEARPRHPVALGAAIAINLAAVGAMLAYTTDMIPHGPDGIPLIKIPPVAQIVKPAERAKAPPKSAQTLPLPRPVQPDPVIKNTPIEPEAAWPDLPPLPSIPTGGDTIAKPLPEPVIASAQIDKRFAGDLQPAYPPALERAETEGKATVRVQVGVDGRVTAVELVRADDPGFFTATRAQALRRWRFRPATRDGQPVVSWVVQTVVFKIVRR